jgi:rfaE bifunctional protein nucleotidyltransferase chain/domain
MTRPAAKLMSLARAVAWRGCLRRQGRKLVVTNGCFDLLHRGHVEYLAAARAQGDALLVLINSDASVRALKGKGRPVLPAADRAAVLAALAAVDAVVVFAAPRCTRELARLALDVYAKGGDYTPKTLDPAERHALEKAGARLAFIPFRPGCSTSALLRKIRGK